MSELLNIVDENDQIIGQETREKIHQDGLLHREIHVYFVTPKKELILQHRAKDKDTFPDLLDATVGGHVEVEQSYKETAIKEAAEETGINIDKHNLIFIAKIKKYSKDKVTGKINYAFQSRYLYIYNSGINDLRIETGKAIGFEVWPIDKLLNLNNSDKARFIPYILEFITTELSGFINNLKL